MVLDGSKLTINLDAAQLSDGVYQLELKSALTGGDSFTFIGDRDNKFFVLTGDWNGSGAVSVFRLRQLQLLVWQVRQYQHERATESATCTRVC